jgi:hypothetical protein
MIFNLGRLVNSPDFAVENKCLNPVGQRRVELGNFLLQKLTRGRVTYRTATFKFSASFVKKVMEI